MINLFARGVLQSDHDSPGVTKLRHPREWQPRKRSTLPGCIFEEDAGKNVLLKYFA